MGDILSQSEIDALLAAMNSGDDSAIIAAPDEVVREARLYDFANPQKFNRDQLRTLENIFENFARGVTSFMTGYLRTSATIEVVNSEAIMYRDFNVALSSPCILAIVELQPLTGGSIIVEMSSNVGYAIIDRILGGPGFGLRRMRDFSEVEKILLERVILQMLNFLPEPWENILPIRPRLEKIETNPQFAQIIAPTDIVALVLLNVKIGSAEGTLSFCLPHLMLEPIMDRLYARFSYDTKRRQEDLAIYKEKLAEELEKARVPVSALVGRTSIMVSDFVNLQVGDVVPLDSYTDSDLIIKVGSMQKFHAKPGTNRGKYAVQITALIEREDAK
ncbi:MAG: flagellar motor switch protein FliM [Defluviitaleaceae bacterium]|nr:flagellar motor switch protein FliM [Defluviitaleaceae bacterium]MCL2240447.1 flagellar motor switch protein FliM [Defluviitaleaceae bacterium]